MEDPNFTAGDGELERDYDRCHCGNFKHRLDNDCGHHGQDAAIQVCAICANTYRVQDESGKYRTCNCYPFDDIAFCPECGREIDRPTGCCPTPSWVCGWAHPDYDPTDAELEQYYSRPSFAERNEIVYHKRQKIR